VTMVVAAQTGTQLQLNCSKPNFQSTTTQPSLAWNYFTPGSNSMNPIYYVPRGQPPVLQNQQFTVTDPTGQGPNYNISFPLTSALSALYICSVLGDTNDIGWDVVGIDPVQCPTSGQQVMQGTSVELNCTVNYYEHTQGGPGKTVPTLSWTTSTGQVISGYQMRNSPTMASIGANITLEPINDQMNFTCSISFPMMASMTLPVVNLYNYTCQTYFTVIYPVSSVNVTYMPMVSNTGSSSTGGSVWNNTTNSTISSGGGSMPVTMLAVPSIVYVGDYLNCSANGRPQPSVVWNNQQQTAVGSGAALQITQAMATQQQPLTFICIATNVVSGVTYIVSENLTVTVEASRGAASAGAEPWQIAVAVCVPVGCVLLAAIIGFLVYRNKKSSSTKKVPVTTNNATPRTTTAYTPLTTTEPIRAKPAPPATTVSRSPPPASSNQKSGALPRTTPPIGGVANLSGHESPAGHGALGVAMYNGSNPALDASYNSANGVPRGAAPPNSAAYNSRNGTTAVNPGVRPSGVAGGNIYSGGAPKGKAPSSDVSSVSSGSSARPVGVAYGGAAPAARPGHSSLAGSEV
jgi:hypothetical protein